MIDGKPSVSIVVPVYNNKEYIGRCLDSLIQQTLINIEIIVVNDGSTDESQIVIDEYVAKHPQLIQSLYINNSGVSVARNTGIEMARGEYIGFVDSDDYVSTLMYEKLYRAAKNHNSDIVSCDFFTINQDGENYVSALRFPSLGKYGQDVVLWNKIYKKSFINLYNFRLYSGIKFGEDKELFIRMLSCTDNIVHLTEGLYYYNCLNLDSVTSKYSHFPTEQRKIVLSLANWSNIKNIKDDNFEYKLIYEVCLYLWFHERNSSNGKDIFKQFRWRILTNNKLRYTFKLKAILMMISPNLVDLLLKR